VNGKKRPHKQISTNGEKKSMVIMSTRKKHPR